MNYVLQLLVNFELIIRKEQEPNKKETKQNKEEVKIGGETR